MSHRPVPISRLILYASPLLAGGAMQFLVSNALISYATDTLLLSAGFVGSMFLVSRIWDAFNDPLIGYWVEKKSKTGTLLSSWIFKSSFFTAGTFALLWINPFAANSIPAAAFFGVMLVLFFSFLTFLFVPHYALASKLGESKKSLSSLFGARVIFENLGTFLAIGLLGVAGTSLAGTHAVIVCLAIALILLSAYQRKRIQEQPSTEGIGSSSSFFHLLKDSRLRIVFFVAVLGQIGATLLMATANYQAKYILQSPEAGSLLVGLFFLAATFSIPLWSLAVRRWGQWNVWLIGEIGLFLSFFGIFLFGLQTGPALFLLCVLAGLAAASPLFLQPTIISSCLSSSDSNHQALGFSLFTFLNKVAMGLAVFVLGTSLEMVGYQGGAAVNPAILETIHRLFSLVPALCFFVAAVVLIYTRSRFEFLKTEQ